MRAGLILGATLLLAIVLTNDRFAAHSTKVEKVSPPTTTSASSPTRVAASTSVDQSDEAGPEMKLVLLALRPEGFEPNELQLTAGEYLFMISNRTGLDSVNVRLEREGKERVAAATVHGRRKEWKQRLKLTPGTYLVTANDKPDWICRIVVGR